MKLKPLLPLLFLAGCATPPPPVDQPGDPSAPSQVTPMEAMRIAESYAKHTWRPFSRNMLHSTDEKGVKVDTPDLTYRPGEERSGYWQPGEVNRGVPYKWGGFDSIESFDQGIATGRAAGDVSTPAKRAADNAAVSGQAVGVDCSGFVARCLKLPSPADTARLPALCDPITQVSEMRPGDLFNIPRRHVLLFAGWARPDQTWAYYYDTGGAPDYWRPTLKQAPLHALLSLGYQPLRYRGMSRAPIPSGKEILTRDVLDAALVVENPTIGEP